MELSPCPACGSPEKRLVYATEAYELSECSDCRLAYKSRWNSGDLRQLNEQLYREDFIRDRGWAKKRLRQVARRRIRLLKRYLPTGKILEVGCGTGEFVECAREAGYSIEAVELSKMPADHVRQRCSIRCYNGLIEEASDDFSGYDAIVAFDVIEHLADPVGFIQSAQARLRPKGILFFEMPMWQCWACRCFGHLWNMVNISDHLLFFDRTSWDRLVERMPLKTLWFGTYEACWEWIHAILFAVLNLKRIRRGSFSFSSNGISTRNNETKVISRFRRFLTRECPARFAQLTAPLSFPVRRWIDRRHMGTEMSVVAQVIP